MRKTDLLLAAAIFAFGTSFTRADSTPSKPSSAVPEIAGPSCGVPCQVCCQRSRWWHPGDWVKQRRCCAPCRDHCCCQRFWEWLTYRPHCCCGCCHWTTAPCCTPPLYQYFPCIDGCVHQRPCPPLCDVARITRDMPWNPPAPYNHPQDPFKRDTLEPKGSASSATPTQSATSPKQISSAVGRELSPGS
jgi:hypothetical protein